MGQITQRDMGAILYHYYMGKYCEDDFNMDNGALYDMIQKQYNNLVSYVGREAVDEIENNIIVSERSGTDYDVLYFSHDSEPQLELQVTSSIDYDGNRILGYNGNSQYIDNGLFLLESTVVDFEDLDNEETEDEEEEE